MHPGTKVRDFAKPKPKPKTEPDGKPKQQRVIKRVEPFSSWQILVQDRCTELRISTRALADKIATPRKSYEHSTLWAWIRSPEGVPPGAAYTQELNARLAAAIEVHPDVLSSAFEESRRKFMQTTSSPGQVGPLAVLRMLFADSMRKTWKTEEIVKLIDNIRGV